jgi:hypothetical protein
MPGDAGSWSNTSSAIHSSRRPRIVVDEQVVSAMP